MLASIRAAGGEVFAITSEPQSLATEAAEDWAIGFGAVGDPHQEIRAQCAERGWIEVFNNEDAGHLDSRDWVRHPKGYYQPAVVAVRRTGQILYRWRCVPRYSNMSGAGARPEANYTWTHIQKALDTEIDAEPDREPVLGADDLPWWRFLLIMTAHGWFLRPRAFPLGRPGEPRVSPGAMMPRVYGFIALWVLAVVLLPPAIVGGLVVLWLAILTPGMIAIHRQFQNEPDPY